MVEQIQVQVQRIERPVYSGWKKFVEELEEDELFNVPVKETELKQIADRSFRHSLVIGLITILFWLTNVRMAGSIS